MLFQDQPELNEGISKVLSRAATDAAFRERCLQDPAGAYAEAAGTALPEGLKLTLHEGQTMEFGLPLPPVATEESPLEDSELDKVSGGASLMSLCCWARSLMGC